MAKIIFSAFSPQFSRCPLASLNAAIILSSLKLFSDIEVSAFSFYIFPMIQSVARALGLLNLIGNSGDAGLPLVELSSRSGLKVPTTHNMLSTLESCGYITRLPDNRHYILGPMALQLGRREDAAQRLATISLPALQELSSSCAETVIVTMLQQGQRRTVAAVESQQLLRVSAHLGQDDHMFETATGRVLLAFASQKDLTNILKELGMPGKKWPQIKNVEDLKKSLLAIRRQCFASYGYGSDRQVHAIAVPVQLSGGPIAALGMYFPAGRYPEVDYQRHFGEPMAAAAQKIASLW